MSDAPTPQRAASAQERERLQLEAEERARGWLEAYNLSLNDGAHPMLPTLTRELVSFGRHALAPILDRITAAEARAEEAERERYEARDQNGIVGPCLWGRYPGTGIWHQIDDGSHTEEEVAAFETDYAAAGWTEMRRTNPFREAKTADRDRLADEVARLRSGVEAALTEACQMGAILLMAGEMTAQERRTARAVAEGLATKVRRAFTATGGTTDVQA